MKIISIIKKNQAVLFPVFDILLNIVNYFFHIFVSWNLIPKEYGILNALLSITAILLVSGLSLQLFAAKSISKAESEVRNIVKDSFRMGLFLILILLTLLPFSMGTLSGVVHSGSIEIILVFIIFALNIFLCIMRGIFQGRKKFLHLNASLYIEGFSKVIFILLLLPLFRNISSALAAILLGMIVSLIHGIILNRNEIKIVGLKNNINKTLLISVGAIFISNFFVFYFTSIDMIFVNYFIPNLSGEYAVVLRYSQIVNFIFLSIMTVLVPNLGETAREGKKLRKTIYKYGIVLIIIEVVLLIVYKFFMPWTIQYLFGIKYTGAGEYFIYGCLAYILLSMTLFLVNINIVLEGRIYLVAMTFSGILMTFLFTVFNKTIYQVLFSEIANYTLLFLIMLIITIREVNVNDLKRD